MANVTMIPCANQKPKEWSEVLDCVANVVIEKVALKKSWTEVGTSSIPKLLTALDGVGQLGDSFKQKLPESIMAVCDTGISVWRAFQPEAPVA